MSRPAELAPSILAADFSELREEIRRVEPYTGRIHADVMDGHFVPNLTMGPALVAAIRPVTAKPIEVHLMVEDPSAFVEPFAEAGADRLIFHVEAAPDPAEIARAISKAGPSAGVALRPATPWERAEPFLELLDLVIVMTVEPGFGGQAFLETMLPKIETAAGAVMKRGLDADIE
ncbi:MAG: ribulose-phosphate 3-epimerase, partial [Actinomycetota bacterium]